MQEYVYSQKPKILSADLIYAVASCEHNKMHFVLRRPNIFYTYVFTPSGQLHTGYKYGI